MKSVKQNCEDGKKLTYNDVLDLEISKEPSLIKKSNGKTFTIIVSRIL